jgi:hypothetical protein
MPAQLLPVPVSPESSTDALTGTARAQGARIGAGLVDDDRVTAPGMLQRVRTCPAGAGKGSVITPCPRFAPAPPSAPITGVTSSSRRAPHHHDFTRTWNVLQQFGFQRRFAEQFGQRPVLQQAFQRSPVTAAAAVALTA